VDTEVPVFLLAEPKRAGVQLHRRTDNAFRDHNAGQLMNELKLVQSGRTSNRARKFAKSGVGKTLEGKMTDYLSARFARDTRVRFSG